jgi:hypothetical protein
MPTIQNGAVALSPAAAVQGRFGTRAASWRDPLRPAPYRGNAEGAPGANQSDEVGSGDAARRFEIRAVSFLLTRLVRSSLAASVRTGGSPARSACPWLVSYMANAPFILVAGWRPGRLQAGGGAAQLPVQREHRGVQLLARGARGRRGETCCNCETGL